MKRIILVISFFMLNACTSLPPSSSQSFSEVEIGKPNEEKAVLVVYRTYLPPTMYKNKIHIDGEHLVSLPNKSFTWMYVEQGEHDLKSNWPAVSMIIGKKLKIDVEAGKYYFLKLEGRMEFTGMGHSYAVNQSGAMEASQALAELEVCCKYVPVGNK